MRTSAWGAAACHGSWATIAPEQSSRVLTRCLASTIQSCSCLVSTSVVHAGCRRQLEQCEAGCEVEVAVNSGCVLFKEGDYQSAAAKFKEAAALDSGHVVRPSHRRWQWLKPTAVHPSTHESVDTRGPTAATCPTAFTHMTGTIWLH